MSSMVPDPVTDDFESYEALEKSQAGDWTLLDRDGNVCGSANGVNTQGITGETAGFFVFDSALGGDYAGSFSAVSGTKQMMTMYSPNGGNDDWAISPELSGNAQTITFYARSYTTGYLATFEVLYSTTDKDPENFISLGHIKDLPTSWTLYSYDLPDGAMYFAIRDITQSNNFMAMFDDVTYTPAQDIVINGYNIYRNGVKINDEPINGTEYADIAPMDGVLEYCVTAVYNIGESRPSESTSIVMDGVNDIAFSTLSVSVDGKDIIVSGAMGQTIEIFAANGILIESISGKDNAKATVSSGIYLVRCAQRVFKVTVR